MAPFVSLFLTANYVFHYKISSTVNLKNKEMQEKETFESLGSYLLRNNNFGIFVYHHSVVYMDLLVLNMDVIMLWVCLLVVLFFIINSSIVLLQPHYKYFNDCIVISHTFISYYPTVGHSDGSRFFTITHSTAISTHHQANSVLCIIS